MSIKKNIKKVVTIGDYYSVSDLATMQLPGMPRSRKGWYDLVDRYKWEWRQVEGGGGKAGVRREYLVTPDVMTLIEARKRSEPAEIAAASAGLAQTMRKGETKGLRYISVTLLARCLDAVDEIASSKNLKPLTTARRLDIAISAYRELTERVLPEPLDLAAFSRLGKEEFAAAATFALWAADIGEDEEDGTNWIVSSL